MNTNHLLTRYFSIAVIQNSKTMQHNAGDTQEYCTATISTYHHKKLR